ncbi:DUF2946 domain-containing protein [Massilia sp. DWR3-1-1]|uniref:DUF2946 domain-containing protein n=1 Tax=Massilia sp. DWR3-1-1 TaxID=2804559 RepID=UPI003CE9C80E
MGLNTLHRRLAAWLACLAMLFGALAPTLSQANAAAAPAGGWTQICSASGSRMVQLDMADPSQDPVHLEHCPFCATHADAVALPPGAAWSVPLLLPAATHPVLFYQSPRPLAIWRAAQSRAPPALA